MGGLYVWLERERVKAINKRDAKFHIDGEIMDNAKPHSNA